MTPDNFNVKIIQTSIKLPFVSSVVIYTILVASISEISLDDAGYNELEVSVGVDN